MGLFPPQIPGPFFLAWSKNTGQKNQVAQDVGCKTCFAWSM